jgi:hypothetical protein
MIQVRYHPIRVLTGTNMARILGSRLTNEEMIMQVPTLPAHLVSDRYALESDSYDQWRMVHCCMPSTNGQVRQIPLTHWQSADDLQFSIDLHAVAAQVRA